MRGSFSKREQEKKKAKARQEKEEKMKQRKLHNNKGASLDDMMAYLDENGNIVSTPPAPQEQKEPGEEDASQTNGPSDNE